MRQIKLIIAALWTILPFAANAVVIDMEGIASAGSSTLESNSTTTFNGFDVFVPHGHYLDAAAIFADAPSNGTDWLVVDHFGDTIDLGFDISASDGSAFSIQSVDASEWDRGFSTGTILTVTGMLFGGGSISTTFATDNIFGFETLTFGSSWTNLVSVNFTDFTGQGTTFGKLGFDNIVVDVVSVPEPGTLALLGIGLLGLGLTRRNVKH